MGVVILAREWSYFQLLEHILYYTAYFSYDNTWGYGNSEIQ